MIFCVLVAPVLITLLWLFSIRPYCIRHGKGYTTGANTAVAFWVDWQLAKEIATAAGDKGMLRVCRWVFWLQVLPIVAILFAIVIEVINQKPS